MTNYTATWIIISIVYIITAEHHLAILDRTARAISKEVF